MANRYRLACSKTCPTGSLTAARSSKRSSSFASMQPRSETAISRRLADAAGP